VGWHQHERTSVERKIMCLPSIRGHVVRECRLVVKMVLSALKCHEGIAAHQWITVAALGFATCSMPSYDRALWALHSWLDSSSGIGMWPTSGGVNDDRSKWPRHARTPR
jgi:hypothetical protein